MLHDFISLYAIEEKSKRTGDHEMTIFGITTLTTKSTRSCEVWKVACDVNSAFFGKLWATSPSFDPNHSHAIVRRRQTASNRTLQHSKLMSY